MTSQDRTHNGKLYVETVGCQMNMLDSELVVAALRKQGYELTSDQSEADTILFNTCSVRERAEHKIYSRLGILKHSKRKRPNQVIGVMGCMAQKDQNLVFKRAPHVDLVVGTGQLAEIPRLVDEARSNRERQLAVSLGRKDGSRADVAGSFESYDPLREPEMRPTPHQAFVRIMIGCDKFCTYCVVPTTRGPEQSRPPSLIVREVEILAEQGVKEVCLLGQTVNSYKHTENGRLHRLSDLLVMIHDTPGIERIKFVTNYPRDMSVDLLEAIRDLPKCFHYLHTPLQSGCDDVLKLMKRGYTVEQYREMMGRINEIVPGCSVSSDFIVGHPGETEESFLRSVESVKEFRFKNSFIFKYSPRPGTKAFERLADDVPEAEKRRRNNLLLAVQNEISEEDNATFIGREVEVFVDGPSKKELRVEGGELSGALRDARRDSRDTLPSTPNVQSSTLQLTGRTRCDRIVVFDGNPRLAGTATNVAIYDASPTTLLGMIVTRELQHGASHALPILA
ncbi:MAG: tRNA (N6-isopentenyl adenosine(37)-C2)-methylthiotransferase MiaB [Planctomycetaceae bacterium]|nr:tRNA (N6-isopentenyl adenosine(37)-C2)-methylthiotransferase MiaB [Planctomycetaceae bacterium]